MDASNEMTDILESFLEQSQIDATDFFIFERKTLSLIDNFKTVLYPVDLFKNSHDSSINDSLVRMCFISINRINIDRNDEFLARKYLSIPLNLYDSLMEFAIDNDFHRSIAILMSRWPYENFSIAKLIPNVLDSWNNLPDNESKLKCLSNATRKYTRCLIIFLDFVKSNSMSPLRVLDLRGMPMGDRVINYIVRAISSLCNNVLHLDDYHIIIDGVICTIDTYIRLMCYLASQKDKPHLHFNKLDLSHLNEVKSRMLLRQINPKELVGLCTTVTLPSGNFCKFITKRFTNLIALEIKNDDSRRKMRCKPLSLRLVPNLRRLSFPADRHYFSVALASDITQLEYLELNDRYLSAGKTCNLIHLASLPIQLQELNLFGHFIVEQDVLHWIKLFNLLIPTLKILEVEGCLISDREYWPLLLNCILRLVNLRYLNLARNRIPLRTLCQTASQLCLMPALEYIRLPYGNESLHYGYTPDDVSPNLRFKNIEEIFATKKLTRVNVVWAPNPHWI